jgi:hypothetical protein
MFSSFKKKSRSYEPTLEPARENEALRFLFWLTGAGLGALMLFSVRCLESTQELTTLQCFLEIFKLFSIGLLIAGTAFAIGGLVGFLFGIPKLISQPELTSDVASDYLDNDNLVQISDWLTKIIVGVGLTQLLRIPKYLESLGNYLAGCFGACGHIASIAIVLYFLIFGFLLSYLWTRLYFRNMLTKADKDNRKEKQQKEASSNAILDEYTDSINSNDPDIKEKIKAILSFSEFTALLDRAKQKMQNGLQLQNFLPEAKKDPNKNQWGGRSEDKERKMSAVVTPFYTSGLYKVVIQVESTNTQNPIKDGETILFSLHQSFTDPYKLVTVKNGIARLEVISYGAFTVGALIHGENIELELDLAHVSGAPSEFREN